MKRTIAAIFLAASLGACGGSSSPTQQMQSATPSNPGSPPTPPTPTNPGSPPTPPTPTNPTNFVLAQSGEIGTSGNSVDYDTATGQYRFYRLGTAEISSIAADSLFDIGTFEGHANDAQTIFGFAHRTPDSLVGMHAVPGFFGGAGAFFSRTSQTDLPTSGTAMYTGDYAGVLRLVENGLLGTSTAGLVSGDVDLTADFGANAISGTITNRVRRRTDSNVASLLHFASDITIDPSTINPDGSFDLNLSGGAIGPIGSPAKLKTASAHLGKGLISGPTGNEVVGGISLTHKNTTVGFAPTTNEFKETGVFFAN